MAEQADNSQDDPVFREIAERREKFLLDVSSAQNTFIRRHKAEWYAQGYVVGYVKGYAQGYAISVNRGEIKGKIDSLVRILTKRLTPLPKSLTAVLTALTDIDEIDRLLDIALDVPTLKEFKKHLP